MVNFHFLSEDYGNEILAEEPFWLVKKRAREIVCPPFVSIASKNSKTLCVQKIWQKFLILDSVIVDFVTNFEVIYLKTFVCLITVLCLT